MRDSRTAAAVWICRAQEVKPLSTVPIEPGKRSQEIDGFGVNLNGPCFRESARPMVDMLIDDLGATIFRLDAYGFDLSNWDVYQTTKTLDCSKAGSVPVVNGTADLELPDEVIFTLTGSVGRP